MEKRLNKLEEAMTNMLNTQTALGTQMITLSERQSKSESSFIKQIASLSKRMMQSEKMIIDILNEHTRILNNLPDAIIERVGLTR